jgi:hypothetical protein
LCNSQVVFPAVNGETHPWHARLYGSWETNCCLDISANQLLNCTKVYSELRVIHQNAWELALYLGLSFSLTPVLFESSLSCLFRLSRLCIFSFKVYWTRNGYYRMFSNQTRISFLASSTTHLMPFVRSCWMRRLFAPSRF